MFCSIFKKTNLLCGFCRDSGKEISLVRDDLSTPNFSSFCLVLANQKSDRLGATTHAEGRLVRCSVHLSARERRQGQDSCEAARQASRTEGRWQEVPGLLSSLGAAAGEHGFINAPSLAVLSRAAGVRASCEFGVAW